MMGHMQRKPFMIPIRSLLLFVAVVAFVLVGFALFGDTVDAWTEARLAEAQQRPFLTAMILMALLLVDIVFPVPSSVISTACGIFLGVWAGTLASFAGMTGTVVAGYALGRYAAKPTEYLIGAREAEMLHAFHVRHGLWLLLALRPVPVLAETSVLFSGIARLRFGPVLAVTAIGNLSVSLVYVLVGVWGRKSGSFLLAFGVSIVVTGLVFLVSRLVAWHRARRKDWNRKQE